jgi:hypothetical protein
VSQHAAPERLQDPKQQGNTLCRASASVCKHGAALYMQERPLRTSGNGTPKRGLSGNLLCHYFAGSKCAIALDLSTTTGC